VIVTIQIGCLQFSETLRGLIGEKIVIDRSGFFIVEMIRQILPDVEITILPETNDLLEIAQEIAKSHVFIACHISSLVLAAFARCVVIEIQPVGLGCLVHGETWAHVSAAVHLRLAKDSNCHCGRKNLTYYLKEPYEWPKVNPRELRNVIKRGLTMVGNQQNHDAMGTQSAGR
jgi:hypothetical protein